jgi:hypothetical protein
MEEKCIPSLEFVILVYDRKSCFTPFILIIESYDESV